MKRPTKPEKMPMKTRASYSDLAQSIAAFPPPLPAKADA